MTTNGLKDPALAFFTTNEIKPRGWLKRQLEIQAEGLSGNLDRMWPHIRESRWIGGTMDGPATAVFGERVPYWLDGFIPLAYLLDNSDMKARAKRFIDRIIADQKEDGWLCPCEDTARWDYDIWIYFLLLKVLALYADCSGDGRIEGVMGKALKSIESHINMHTLFNWGSARWYECLIPIFWLYERTHENWLLELARRLEIQGIDYDKLFTSYMDAGPARKWTFLTHGPNLAMSYKAGALMSRINGGDPDVLAAKITDTLLKYHGTIYGHFNADECLAGTSPIQGSELCSITEAMYSFEQVLSTGGNPKWGDYLERLAFNGLPATISPDMWTHQYDQQVNQVQCSYLPKDKVIFTTNSNESHLFGLEPNYGCCTANFNQGWPKLALSAFMCSPDGIASTVLIPSEVNCKINDANVKIILDTEYPFKSSLRYTVETSVPVHFTLSIRIPAWAKSVKADGSTALPCTFHKIEKEWKGKTEINIEMEFETELVERPNKMYALRRGPLVYSIAPKERWVKHEYVKDGTERKFPYCDYEIFPESPWNYAFGGGGMEVIEQPVSETPFSPEKPPVKIRTKMLPIEWNIENGLCEERPSGKTIGKSVLCDFIPYGCTNLRITEMPKICQP